ncbi:MAG: diaminopimelate decarboxylase [Bacteroidales bacterium]|nr:diaminopimelate decarboxylase [Bacteroidales bacterium]
MKDLSAYKNAFSVIETPFYFYDTELLQRTVDEVSRASAKYGIDVHYAVKANVEERLLQIISAAGIGADAVSGNEVSRAVECGFPKNKVVFAGVGKTDKEIRQSLGIEAFNVESLQELEVIDSIAGAEGVMADVSLRINPGVDAHTHKFITTGLEANKFGLVPEEFQAAADLLGRLKNVRFTGLHFHVGSQITDIQEVFSQECARANEIAGFFESQGLKMEHIDLGGGLGVDYLTPDQNPVPDFELWFRTLSENMPRREGVRLFAEPGRSLVAQCGSLITKVLYIKKRTSKTFAVVDAGMNNLVRPALYGAYHRIDNICSQAPAEVYDIVGPVCESSDVWGTDRPLASCGRGDLLAIRSAGAYGSVMSSSYNLRDKAPAYFSDDFNI